MGSDLLRKIWQRPRGAVCLCILATLYLLALLAPILSPYLPTDQDLAKPFHPPTPPIWSGGVAVRVFENIDKNAAIYRPIQGATASVVWFPQVPRRHILGFIPIERALFGVEAPQRIYLLGSDETGRDIFSRLLYGAQVSMTIGLVAICITTTLALTVGGLAGYFGGWFDWIAMRITEFLMTIPSLFLLLSLRAGLNEFFTKNPELIYFLIVIILSFIGWAGTARVIRGLTLSLRERPFIQAAETLGQRPGRILMRHLFPNLASYIIVTSTLAIPGYILGEAALSFLGLGIQEPAVSWGSMLSQAQEMKVFMLGFWWLLLPGLAIFISVIAFNVLGDVVRDIVDPRFRTTP